MPSVGSKPTVRELQVLRLVCQPGGSVALAAYTLGISPHTARHTLRKLYGRLGVNSMAQAAFVLWGTGDDAPQRAAMP